MKRMLFLVLSFLILILLLLVNWIFLLLDHLFYPGFRKTEVKRPVFIIGMPRSATSLCFSILSSDKEHFTAMKLWEILFAPSVIQKRFFLFLKSIDRFSGNFLYRSFRRFDRYFFRKNEGYHKVSLFDCEEDDFLLLNILSTPELIFLFPMWRKLYLLTDFDRSLNQRKKRFIMKFYRNCIKRHLYVFGNGGRYLAKNPSQTSRIMSLTETFKGACFIYMLRNPLYSMASALNMYRHFGKMVHSRINKESVISRTLNLADNYYYYPLVSCNELIGRTVFICYFKNITADCTDEIKAIYGFTGLEPPDGLIKTLSERENITGKHIAQNRYTIEEVGLDEKSVYERYKYVYTHFTV